MNEDRYDRLWIGHNNGVSVYDYNNDSFCNYVCEHNDNAILNTVICIFRTRRQDMLLGTYFSGLFRVGNLDSGVEYYTLGSSGPSLRTRNVAANGIQRDVRGNLWAGSLASGLYCLAPDGRIRQYTNHAGDTASISSGNILLLCPLNAMKLDLFSCISYEFKTPLSVISTLQDSVLPPSDGDAGSDPAIFRRNIERLDFLVNQLLDFRNIESRNISVSIRKYDLVPFLSNIYETFVPLYNRK